MTGAVLGAARGGITISISGAAAASTTTDASGNYSFHGLVDGTYSIVPSLPGGYLFFPSASSVAINGQDVVVQPFTVSGARRISGAVTGRVVAGVNLALGGAATAAAVTDARGGFSFDGLVDGRYTVTPSLAGGFVFSPLTASVIVSGADAAGLSFEGVGAYSISGAVGGAVKAGVTVILGGDASAATTTDVAGNYSFIALPDGDYTIAPSLAGGYAFSPASLSASLRGAGASGRDFVVRGAFTVSGSVVGPARAGVTVALEGPSGATTTTDAAGRYSFTGLANGSYAVRPSLLGYSFSPVTASAVVNGADVAGKDFAEQGNYSIFGTVSGLVTAGVTVTLGGAAVASTLTDQSGNYSFAGLSDGDYTLTPSVAGGYAFSPATLATAVRGANATGRNFTSGGALSISGTIRGPYLTPVQLALSGPRSLFVYATSAGDFSFSGLPNGAYTVTPIPAGGYVFTPAAATVNLSDANVGGVAFTDAGAYSISGHVLTAAAAPLAGATVTLNGSRTATTDAAGAYSFDALPNGSYTIVPASGSALFAPDQLAAAVNGQSLVNQDFRTCSAVQPTGSSAVAYQIDVRHSGGQPADTLSLPLCRRWARDLGAAVSYPLVAGGRVFVTLGQTGTARTSVAALDQHTGAILWGPVDLGGSYPNATAAYDNGRLFAVNSGGLLSALDAATGAILWTKQLPGQYFFSSAPTATAGRVYVGGAGSGGTVYSVDQLDGGVAWTASVANGDDSSPAVSGGKVYVSYACNQAYAFDAADGGALWHHSSGCSGGGGKTVAVANGRVYTRDFDGDLVLDASDGGLIGLYTSTKIPAFSSSQVFYNFANVQAAALDGGPGGWTFDAGGAQVQAAPIVVGPHLVIGLSDGRLLAVDAATGAIASSAVVPNMLAPDEQNVGRPLAGVTAADGMLFVPAGTSLIAF